MGEEAKQEVEAKQEEKKEEKSEEKKEDKAEEKQKEAKPGSPPPIVLAVDLHCVGCAKKIEKSILKCRGVERVEVDMMQNQVTVKGLVDPQVLCSRIQKRTMRKAKVVSPLPPAEGDPKPEDAPPPVSTGVTSVELLVNMHCEACAEQLKRKILKMRGVQTAETNMSAGKLTVTGTMNGEKVVEYIHRRTGKIASIVPPPPPPKEEEKKEEEAEKKKPEDNKPTEEKKEESAEKKEEEKAAEAQEGKDEKRGGGEQKKEGEGEAVTAAGEEDMMKKMIYWNPNFAGPNFAGPNFVGPNFAGPNFVGPNFVSEEEMARRRMMPWMPVYVIQRPLPPPPQLFSDENPNACCIT